MEIKDIMKNMKDDLADFLMKEVGRQPMVIPMYVYISRTGEQPVKQASPSSNSYAQKASATKFAKPALTTSAPVVGSPMVDAPAGTFIDAPMIDAPVGTFIETPIGGDGSQDFVVPTSVPTYSPAEIGQTPEQGESTTTTTATIITSPVEPTTNEYKKSSLSS